MINKNIYIEQLISKLSQDGIFEMSSDDYVSEEVLRRHTLKFVDNNIKYGMDFHLTDNQLQIILDESRIETIKNTITFLSDKNILTPSGIDRSTGEFIYTLTDEGKHLYKKIFID